MLLPLLHESGGHPGFRGFPGEAPTEIISKLTYSDLRSSNISDQAFSRAGFSAQDKADLPLIMQRGGKRNLGKG
jgi:hypothetical protein